MTIVLSNPHIWNPNAPWEESRQKGGLDIFKLDMAWSSWLIMILPGYVCQGILEKMRRQVGGLSKAGRSHQCE